MKCNIDFIFLSSINGLMILIDKIVSDKRLWQIPGNSPTTSRCVVTISMALLTTHHTPYSVKLAAFSDKKNPYITQASLKCNGHLEA